MEIADATLQQAQASSRAGLSVLPGPKWRAVLQVSLRNLWRNRRRSWLTVGGIAFAVFLLVFARSLQDGTFIGMIDNIAHMLIGHVQVQHPDYAEERQIEHLVDDVRKRVALARDIPGVAHVSARAEAFALASHDERSFGAQVMGVQPEVESQWNSLAQFPETGRYLTGPGEVYLGVTLARNLGVGLDDELVFLGTAYRGGVAAMVTRVVGTFESASSELNRALAIVQLDEFREAWALAPDSAHSLVVAAGSVAAGEQVALELAQAMAQEGLNKGVSTRDWRSLMPQAEQTIDLKRISTEFFFILIAVIVTFSIVNTFMMTLFERTPEFGMLMALGMRPTTLIVMLQLEALWLALMGVGIGAGLAWVIVELTAINGIPVPETAQAMAAEMNMPTRFYPMFNTSALQFAVACMLISTQVASLLPGLRLTQIEPAEALRAHTT